MPTKLMISKSLWVFVSGAQGPPQFLKKSSENGVANENLSCGFPSIPGIALGVAPGFLVFHVAQVVGCHSENGISYSENGISNSESRSELARNSPRAPRMAFSLRERFS